MFLGVKPLSVFGAFHLLSGNRLRQEHHKYFPLINSEGGKPGDFDSGVVSFLRENLLDLGPVGQVTANEDTGSLGSAGSDFELGNMRFNGSSVPKEAATAVSPVRDP